MSLSQRVGPEPIWTSERAQHTAPGCLLLPLPLARSDVRGQGGRGTRMRRRTHAHRRIRLRSGNSTTTLFWASEHAWEPAVPSCATHNDGTVDCYNLRLLGNRSVPKPQVEVLAQVLRSWQTPTTLRNSIRRRRRWRWSCKKVNRPMTVHDYEQHTYSTTVTCSEKPAKPGLSCIQLLVLFDSQILMLLIGYSNATVSNDFLPQRRFQEHFPSNPMVLEHTLLRSIT